MKSQVSLLIFFCFCFLSSFAQEIQSITFTYSCVPTSTTDYSILINRDKFILHQTIKKNPNKEGIVRKVVSTNYTHTFDSNEKRYIDSIIIVYRLDSIGLYQNRMTEWGTHWKIEIRQNSITFNIQLPNYNNGGLESLIRFIHCLIPKKELPVVECKSCK